MKKQTVTIKLSPTQAKVLLLSLDELHSLESNSICNDCDSDDKFYRLNKREQNSATYNSVNEDYDNPFNCTATEYLYDVISKQVNR